MKRTFNKMGLRRAARRGEIDTVRQYLDAGIPVDVANDFGWTALTWAASKGHVEVMRLLIDRGAALDVQDQQGNTPLIEAAKAGHLEALRLLLDKGASVTLHGEPGAYGTTTPMGAAVSSCNIEIVRELIRHGADMEEASYYYGTPLLMAAKTGWLEGVSALIDAGADVHTAHGVLGSSQFPWSCYGEERKAIQKLFDAELEAEREDRCRRHGIKRPGTSAPPKHPPGFSL